jgi:hypothetical protein
MIIYKNKKYLTNSGLLLVKQAKPKLLERREIISYASSSLGFFYAKKEMIRKKD